MSQEDNKKTLLVKGTNLTAGYENEVILPNISFEVHQKDFIGIIGPNGGGKTTLIKLILGLLQPFSGELQYGPDLKASPDFQIGYLPQQNRIDKAFPISVFDVVRSGLITDWNKALRNIKGASERVHQVLELVHMLPYQKSPIGALSGGQLQRVLLARALVSNPSLLILDEPNTYVDKRFEGHLYSLLPEINRETAILIISHDVGSVQKLVSSIFCVDHGLHIHQDVKTFAGNPSDHSIE